MGGGHAHLAATHGKRAPATASGFRRWVIRHEDSWIFTILYVGLAVALSLLVSLFWLVVLVVVHFVMEWVALGEVHPTLGRRSLEAAWAVKLDVALLVFALVLSLYLEAIFGVLGLRSAAQVGAAVRATGRFAAMERAVRGVLLSLDDAAYVLRAVIMRRPRPAKRQRKAHVARHRNAAALHAPRKPGVPPPASWARRWGAADWIATTIFLAGVGLVVAAPLLTDYSYAGTAARIAQDLRPFP